MRILGIESSCDETAASVVKNGITVLSNTIASTKDIFKDIGGVVPEDAARHQVEYILPVYHAALKEAGCGFDDIDAIAVTRGPGLLGSLIVGTTAARVLASFHKKPLIGVHHTLGHLSSVWLSDDTQSSDPVFPCITLSVSGGHSDIWYRESHTKGELIGQTRDDAAGEAFDKGASMLSLPYPGGPSISKAAQNGDEHAIKFPIALKDEDTCDFSFSGLKTALKVELRIENYALSISDAAASYQYAICMQLVNRICTAVKRFPDAREIHLVGGVSANTRLREMIRTTIPDFPLRAPAKLGYCTDNAAMIAAAGYFLVMETGDSAYAPFSTGASSAL